MSGSKHGCGFEVVARDERGHATSWLAACSCGSKWVAPSYEAAEDEWRKHCHALTGIAPKPMGVKQGRWSPTTSGPVGVAT